MPDYSAAGKHIVITGGTSGLGLETARLLVAAGRRPRGWIRSGQGRRGRADPQHGSRRQRPGDLRPADLASLQDVRALAATITERIYHLDVLINNAGIITTERVQTVDGFERKIAGELPRAIRSHQRVVAAPAGLGTLARPVSDSGG